MAIYVRVSPKRRVKKLYIYPSFSPLYFSLKHNLSLHGLIFWRSFVLVEPYFFSKTELDSVSSLSPLFLPRSPPPSHLSLVIRLKNVYERSPTYCHSPRAASNIFCRFIVFTQDTKDCSFRRGDIYKLPCRAFYIQSTLVQGSLNKPLRTSTTACRRWTGLFPRETRIGRDGGDRRH